MSATMTEAPGKDLVPINIEASLKNAQRALTVIDQEAGNNQPEPVSVLDPDRRVTISKYGLEVFQQLSSFADLVLEKAQMDTLGPLGEPLNEFAMIVKGLDPTRLTSKSILARLKRLIVGVRSEMAAFSAQFQNARDRTDGIAMNLQGLGQTALEQVDILDNLHAKVQQMVKEITPIITRARATHSHWKNVLLPARKKEAAAAAANEAEASGLAGRVSDLEESIDSLGEHILMLEQARFMAVMRGPSVREIQSKAERAANRVTATVGMSIPMWKTQMVEGLARAGVLAAESGIAKAREATDLMYAREAQMRGETVKLGAQNSAKGLASTDTLINAMKDIQKAMQDTALAMREAEEARKAQISVMKSAETGFLQFMRDSDSPGTAARLAAS